jgi:hypothetical protein
MVLQKSTLFDEKTADEAVIDSLWKTIKFLEGELKMAKIIKSVEGKYYTGEFEEIDASRVTELIAKKQAELSELEAIAPSSDPAPADPVVDPVVDPAAPVDPATPALPADPTVADPAAAAAPALPAAPADAVVPPVDTTVADPNAVVPPIVDPNLQ